MGVSIRNTPVINLQHNLLFTPLCEWHCGPRVDPVPVVGSFGSNTQVPLSVKLALGHSFSGVCQGFDSVRVLVAKTHVLGVVMLF